MVLFLALCGKALSPESAACYSCASAVSAHKQMEIGNSGSARRQSDQFFARAAQAQQNWSDWRRALPELSLSICSWALTAEEHE